MLNLTNTIRLTVTAGLAVLLLAAAPAAQAQLRARHPALATAAPGGDGPLLVAYAPQRLRNRLMAIHGFSRDDLNSVSTDVAAILRGFILDPAEAMVVRRQAIKALRLYPDETNFQFIREHIAEAPLNLKRLYVGSLRGFAPARAGEITGMLEPLLASPERTLRHAALGLAETLPPSEALRTMLRNRLPLEPEPDVRQRIQQMLSR